MENSNEAARPQDDPILDKKLLDNSKEAALWARNVHESPLLRLPAEIRLIIFNYVLGGYTIYIYSTWFSTYLCRTFGSRIYDASVDPFSGDRMVHPHGLLQINNIGQIRDFTLLSGVCRQLYFDTALLPFRINIWAFASFFVQEAFVAADRRISLAQRDAINTMFESRICPGPNRFFPGLSKLFISHYAPLVVTTHVVKHGPEPEEEIWVPVENGIYRWPHNKTASVWGTRIVVSRRSA